MAYVYGLPCVMLSMSGKGSRQRPTNKPTFDENFDRIFGKPKQAEKKVKKDESRHKG